MIKRETIKSLRPPLRDVAPLTYWVSLGFALANFGMWFLLTHVPITAIKTNPVPIVNGITTYGLWGWWFMALSVAMLIGLWRNNWDLVKRTLMAGLVTKLIWTYALLYMLLHGIPAFATFILWAFLAWTQAWTIVFFAPTISHERHDTLPENERYRDVN